MNTFCTHGSNYFVYFTTTNIVYSLLLSTSTHSKVLIYDITRGCHGCDRMVVGFTTTCADNAYHHYRCEFESHSWRSLLDTTLSDNLLSVSTGQWFSQSTLVSSINKTDCHDITEILLKVELNTITTLYRYL